MHRTVAVKVLSTHQAGDEESQRRFQTEARSAARLDHPNIARVHYVGEDRGLRYIVFEYIDGANVRDLVYANGPLPLADALNYTLQIANALTHAWEREVVHRDIKPSNILITPDGQAKLVDMGLARLEQLDDTANEETATGVTLGTFDYISPEQARNPRDADIAQRHLFARLHVVLHARPASRRFPTARCCRSCCSIKANRRRTCDSSGPTCPIRWPACWPRCWPSGRKIDFKLRPSLSAALAGCTDQLGLAPVQVALPAYWTNWAPRPTASRPPRPVARADGRALAQRARAGTVVEPRSNSARVLGTANSAGTGNGKRRGQQWAGNSKQGA